MKLEVEKDRLKINKIIENVLPLMIKNKNLTQECADAIILYFIDKNEGCGLLIAQSGEDNILCGGKPLLGKKRYCSHCSAKAKETSK